MSLIYKCAGSMDDRDLEGDMEELGVRLGSNLKLSEKERKVNVIGRKEVEEALIGFHLCAVVEVLMNKEVHRNAFINRFMSLCRGKSGVSIKDLGGRRFLARFVTEQDLTCVTDADHPWTFKDDLIMVSDRTHACKNQWAPLTYRVFWLQLHNIPHLSMTGELALAIGGLMVIVLKVDMSVSKECIGRFLRVKVRFNVKEQLMRGTHVQFPDEGMIWVNFKYESLPNYCLICGLLGHPSRICKERMEWTYTRLGGEKKGDVLYAFKDLDAV